MTFIVSDSNHVKVRALTVCATAPVINIFAVVNNTGNDFFAIDFVEFIRIDDPIGAFAVHGACGIWGTWSIGLFATGQWNDVKGIFWGGSWKQLWVQLFGNVVIGGVAFVVAFALMHAVKLTKTLRISEEGELEGIDIHEHGSPAYHPEAAYMGKGL